MKVLSIRAPWPYFIFHGDKNIENRRWCTDIRGPVFIHVSKWWNAGEVICTLLQHFDTINRPDILSLDVARQLDFATQFANAEIMPTCGCIIGTVNIMDCIRPGKCDPMGYRKSRWFVGPCGLVLSNPQLLSTPIACRGALGFFHIPYDVLSAVYNTSYVD